MKEKGQMMFVMSKLILIILLVGLMAITLYTYNFFQASTMRSYATALVSRLTTVSDSVAKSGSSQDLQIFTLPYTIGSSTNQVVYGLKITTTEENEEAYAVMCLYPEKNLRTNEEEGGAIACNSFALEKGTIRLVKYPEYTTDPETYPSEGEEELEIIPRDGQDKLIIKKITVCNGKCEPKICLAACSSTTQVGADPIKQCKTALANENVCG